MKRLFRTTSFGSPASPRNFYDFFRTRAKNCVVTGRIDQEIMEDARESVSYFGKEMLKNGDYDKSKLIEKSFEKVSGKSVEELRKMPLEELDLNSKLNDQWEAVHQAVEPSAMNYVPKESPLLSEYFRPEEDYEDGFLTRITEWTKRHPKATVAILGGVVIGVAATYIAANYFLNMSPSFDTDRDGLLNGTDENVPKDSEQAAKYINAGIIHRENPNRTYTFFGEKTLGSDPHVPSPAARDNALFLSNVSQAEYDKINVDGNLANFNIDGDSWSNRFEQLTGSPYNVKNDIYAIIMTHAGQGYPPVKEMFDILEKAKIPKENIYDLSLENNNSAEFKKAVDKVAQVSDKNDTVLFVIDGEGIPGEFQFHGVVENGVWHPLESVPYTWFRDVTDKIISKNKVFILDTCYSGSAIKDLKDENKIILTAGTDKQEVDFGIAHYFLKAFSNSSADTDKSKHVSIGEAAEYAKNRENTELETPQISDVSDIGKTSYLIEQIVD